MSINFKLLGKRVKELRCGKGITQTELANRCNTSAQYLSQIENGKKQASLQILVALSEGLSVSLDELLTGNQIMNEREYNTEIEQIFEDCSQYEKRILFEMLVNMKSVLKGNIELLHREIEKY